MTTGHLKIIHKNRRFEQKKKSNFGADGLSDGRSWTVMEVTIGHLINALFMIPDSMRLLGIP